MVAVGIDIGGTNIKAGIVDRRGNLVTRGKTPLRHTGDLSILCDDIALLVDRLAREADLREGAIDRAGCGVPGLLDRDRRVLLTSPNIPEWRNAPLKRSLERRLRIPLLLENDANLAAVGESWTGAAKGRRSAVVFTIGTGIGGGIILNRRLWTGATGCAGEVGHLIVHHGGRRCGCGGRGCVEQYSSATGIVKSYLRKSARRNGIDAKTIFAMAKRGSDLARRVVVESVRYLSSAIAGLVSVIQPEVFVLSGGVSKAGPYLERLVRREVALLVPPPLRKTYRIVRGSLGEWAGVIGAAGWAYRRNRLPEPL